MLIDSHCHLPRLDSAELSGIIDRAKQNDVVKFINIGTNFNENKKVLETAQAFDQVYATIAIYPHEERDKTLIEMENHLKNLLHSPKLVAIGECGVDISEEHEGRPLAEQLELFEMQIKLAIDADLPLVIHNRNGDTKVIELLQKYKSPSLRGVAHCFASNWDVAKQYLDLNFYISFSGLITYQSRAHLLETVKNVPSDRYLIETDAPYLTPKGVSGQDKQRPNEPKNVRIVAQKVASVRNCSYEQIADETYNNTCRLFNL